MRQFIYFAVTICLLAGACKKENGTAGLTSLINIIPVDPGTQCETGGIAVETGLDANNNGLLDAPEVTDMQNICNGATGTSGHTGLVRTSSLPANDICPTGGLQIQTGIDINDNGVLEDSEVQQTQQICNGDNGIYDKQIAILVTGLGVGRGTNGTTPAVVSGDAVRFNIENFPGVDSAVFVVNRASSSTEGATLNVKLFDVTDSLAFDNSLVSAGSSSLVSLYSANIFPDLPKKDIDLGIQLYMDQDDASGQFSNSYLVLYRK